MRGRMSSNRQNMRQTIFQPIVDTGLGNLVIAVITAGRGAVQGILRCTLPPGTMAVVVIGGGPLFHSQKR